MKPVIKTISEVKDAKEHLEDQISCLLMQFEKITEYISPI